MNTRIDETLLIQNAYQEALRFTKSHYENFPVVSLFLPKHLQKHVAVVYKFAREADDYADEGKISTSERLSLLNEHEKYLNESLTGLYHDDFWHALSNTILECDLTTQNFLKLLSAFKQDVIKKTYNTYEEVLDYCERSANPVGRIILELFSVKNDELFSYSDSICTALQLTNFYQDVSIDIIKERIYLPLNDIQKFNIRLEQFQSKEFNQNFKLLMKYEINRTRELFQRGSKLIPYLPDNLKKQIKMTIMGGEKILDKIASLDYDVLNSRPRLSKFNYAAIFLKSVTV